MPSRSRHRRRKLQFFSEGYRPETATSSGRWMSRTLPWGPVASAISPFRSLCNWRGTPQSRPLKNSSMRSSIGELIASGITPATGVRRDIEPAEWTRSGLILDVINGDLIDGRYGKSCAVVEHQAAGGDKAQLGHSAARPEPGRLGLAHDVRGAPERSGLSTVQARKPHRQPEGTGPVTFSRRRG